jgi:hypothetical protein
MTPGFAWTIADPKRAGDPNRTFKTPTGPLLELIDDPPGAPSPVDQWGIAVSSTFSAPSVWQVKKKEHIIISTPRFGF